MPFEELVIGYLKGKVIEGIKKIPENLHDTYTDTLDRAVKELSNRYPDLEITTIDTFLSQPELDELIRKCSTYPDKDAFLKSSQIEFFKLFDDKVFTEDDAASILEDFFDILLSEIEKNPELVDYLQTYLLKKTYQTTGKIDKKTDEIDKKVDKIVKKMGVDIEVNFDENVTNYVNNIISSEEKNRHIQHYTKLSVLQIAVEDTFPTTVRTKEQNKQLEVSELVETEPKLIIAGDSGSGKTTTLRWLEYKYAGRYLEKSSSFVPIYIDLSLFDSGEFLDHVADIVEGKGLNKGVLEILLKEKAVLLIDGLDLLSSTEGFDPYTKLSKFVIKYRNCRYVVTSRRGYFESFHSRVGEVKKDFKISEIEELDKTKILEFVVNHLGTGEVASRIEDKIEKDENLLSILKNPMMLYIAIKVASLRVREKEILPSMRSELYKEFINYLFSHCQERGTELCADKVQILKAATDLYFYLQCRITVRCDFYKAAGIVEESSRIKGLKQVVGVDVLEDLFDLAIFKREGESVKYGIHQSFQEYFAALKLKDLYKKGTDISPAFTHPRWVEAVKFTSEMVDDPDRFVNSIIDTGNVYLASRCIQNSSTEVKEKLSELLSSKLDSRLELDRRNAVEGLGRLGEFGMVALLNALSDKYSDVRRSVAWALGDIGSEEAVRALIKEASDEYSDVRSIAVWALGNIGSEEAVPILVKTLSDEHSFDRGSAAWGLGNIGSKEAVRALINALSGEDRDVRSDAAWALGNIGSEEAVRALLNALSGEDRDVRNSAASALGNIGSEEAVRALLNALSDKEMSVRSSAAWGLGNIGSEEAVPALLKSLSGEYSDVRSSAASALGNIGSEEAVPALIEALSDEDWHVRSSAASALGKIRSEEAVPALLKSLSGEYSDVRNSAASALGNIGSEEAVPALIKSLSDEEMSVRSSAASALGNIGSEEAVPALIEALSGEDWHVRSSAASALGNIGSKEAVRALINALSGEYSDVRSSAASVLGNIGSEEAVPALIEALSDENWSVRSSAASALGNIGSKEAVRALINALSGEDRVVHNSAVGPLKTICNINHKEKIIPLLDSNNYFIANAAFEIIYEIDRKDASEKELFTDLFSYLEE